ncbi:uncharacterized protein LOC124479135 isoform X4 [Hypomesus transpacificus]|uniref:uncharacterized protein LOC124479135 isoform X4 n=1 Tax=Hypomesus transpacificus TaxID=137520 RepID=UPI001F085ECE|nr:uncharacterized protein LOC124479135 isoform X4 [Hypomesus transpacificus]
MGPREVQVVVPVLEPGWEQAWGWERGWGTDWEWAWVLREGNVEGMEAMEHSQDTGLEWDQERVPDLVLEVGTPLGRGQRHLNRAMVQELVEPMDRVLDPTAMVELLVGLLDRALNHPNLDTVQELGYPLELVLRMDMDQQLGAPMIRELEELVRQMEVVQQLGTVQALVWDLLMVRGPKAMAMDQEMEVPQVLKAMEMVLEQEVPMVRVLKAMGTVQALFWDLLMVRGPKAMDSPAQALRTVQELEVPVIRESKATATVAGLGTIQATLALLMDTEQVLDKVATHRVEQGDIHRVEQGDIHRVEQGDIHRVEQGDIHRVPTHRVEQENLLVPVWDRVATHRGVIHRVAIPRGVIHRVEQENLLVPVWDKGATHRVHTHKQDTHRVHTHKQDTHRVEQENLQARAKRAGPKQCLQAMATATATALAALVTVREMLTQCWLMVLGLEAKQGRVEALEAEPITDRARGCLGNTGALVQLVLCPMEDSLWCPLAWGLMGNLEDTAEGPMEEFNPWVWAPTLA